MPDKLCWHEANNKSQHQEIRNITFGGKEAINISILQFTLLYERETLVKKQLPTFKRWKLNDVISGKGAGKGRFLVVGTMCNCVAPLHTFQLSLNLTYWGE
jgi:hypothetical protein